MQSAIAGDRFAAADLLSKATTFVRANAPSRMEWLLTSASTLLLILSFPNPDLFFLAWVALVPLLLVLKKSHSLFRAFLLGWAVGSTFFYVTCHWLTYSMIHYGGIPAPIAYLLLIPGALVIGLFPALFCVLTVFAIKRWGYVGLLLAPVFWAACEWLRLGVTGQLWNALGYSQAYHPLLIQAAAWGGVYLISFLIVSVNTAVVLIVIGRMRERIIAVGVIASVGLITLTAEVVNNRTQDRSWYYTNLQVVAVQPNVPMSLIKSAGELQELRQRHLDLSKEGLAQIKDDQRARLVIWPESPMNFTYTTDRELQSVVQKFITENRAPVILNSLEPAPNDGGFNSAVLVNEQGRVISQYDKIRLMPFGEYVPLPSWLGGSLISGLVGEFSPGDKYTLMPVADHRAGVFICIESAYPWIARRMTAEGADVLINISNDGYLGPTAVMRQHLANTVFRAVENGRPLLRVANTGISAQISSTGVISHVTDGFVPAVRVWSVDYGRNRQTIYTKYGDRFVAICTLVTVISLLLGFASKSKEFHN